MSRGVPVYTAKIQLEVTPAMKEQIHDAAVRAELSANAWIRAAIAEKLEREHKA